jgi:hypothetical protein
MNSKKNLKAVKPQSLKIVKQPAEKKVAPYGRTNNFNHNQTVLRQVSQKKAAKQSLKIAKQPAEKKIAPLATSNGHTNNFNHNQTVLHDRPNRKKVAAPVGLSLRIEKAPAERKVAPSGLALDEPLGPRNLSHRTSL